MARQPAKRTQAQVAAYAPAFNGGARNGTALYIAGLFALLIAVAMTGLLVLEKIKGIALPGCGAGSACATAQASVWGRIPGLDLPVSFVGFGYFTGLLVAWLRSRDGVSLSFKLLVRLGLLASIFYVGVIVAQKHLCPYCIAMHAANAVFWLVVERSRLKEPPWLRPVVIVAVVLVTANAILVPLQRSAMARQNRIEEDKLAKSMDEIIKSTAQKSQTTTSTANGSQVAVRPVDPASSQQASPVDPQPSRPRKGAFTGRFLEGPPNAPIRLVLFTDYQCPDCYKTENDIRELMQQRTDVSLSTKHFPMCADCNRHFKQTLHANACWAARCAEAAGILRGNEGFWQMHHLLFDRKGAFEQAELNQFLTALGYDPVQFTQVMTSPETLTNVQSDIEEAIALGLYYTPMVFINGVELKGVFSAKAVPRAVQALAATNPRPMGPEKDDPPLAAEKYIADWREQAVRPIPVDATTWPRGPSGARLRIAMFGDYLESGTAMADAQVQQLIAGRDNVQYVFRSYPFDQTCNPNAFKTMFPNACLAARLAKAAGILGGAESFWKMHTWLLANQKTFGPDSVSTAAAAAGLDPATLAATLDGPQVAAALAEDVRHSHYMIPKGLPTIYINGKFVPRWMREGDNVLERIVREATAAADGK